MLLPNELPHPKRLLTHLIAEFSGSKERTWLGHSVQNIFIAGSTLLFIHLAPTPSAKMIVGGIMVSFWTWAHRELSDVVTPVYKGRLTWKQSFQHFLEDGYMDFYAPLFVGVFLSILAGLILYV